MRATPLLLAAILLLVPVAAACSLAGPVPGPGAFTLWPHDGGAPIEIPVYGRSLGGTCELSNRHTFADGVFAWIESPERHRGNATAHLRDLTSGEERVVELDGGSIDAFGVWDGRIVTSSTDYGSASPEGVTRFQIHHDDGTARTLPFPEGRWTAAAIGGRHVVASLRTNGHEGPDLIYLYDLAEDKFVFEAKPAREIVGGGILWPKAVDDTWILASGYEAGSTLYEISTGRMVAAPPPLAGRGAPGGVAIHDGVAYWWSWDRNVGRVALPDGDPEALPSAEGTVVGVLPGYTVVGDYSGDGNSMLPPESEISGPWIARAFSLIGWLLSAFLGALFR